MGRKTILGFYLVSKKIFHIFIRRIVVKMDGMRPKKLFFSFVKIVCISSHIFFNFFLEIFVFVCFNLLLYFFPRLFSSSSFRIGRSEYSLMVFFIVFVVALQLKFLTRLTIRFKCDGVYIVCLHAFVSVSL